MICALNGELTLDKLYIIKAQTWSTLVWYSFRQGNYLHKIYDRKYLPLNLSWNLTICRSIIKVLFTLDTGLFRTVCVRRTA